MTHPATPRRLLLIAAPAADARDAGAPIRRYRLGRVLMGPEQLMGDQATAAGAATLLPAPRTSRNYE